MFEIIYQQKYEQHLIGFIIVKNFLSQKHAIVLQGQWYYNISSLKESLKANVAWYADVAHNFLRLEPRWFTKNKNDDDS